MALSRRGRDALAYVGCETTIVNNGIAMRARMIHELNCTKHPIPYGTRVDHEILSIDRHSFVALAEASKRPNITIHFQHKFTGWEEDQKIASFHDASGNRVDFRVDAVIGYDGCHSAVRTAMMKLDAINVAQEYFETYYMEFCIPPKNDQFVMEPNYLHIWPRHQFMLIALPNQDKSFTTTLFSPISIFRKLKTADDVMNFFRQYFPDAVSFIGANEIVETFFSSKPQPLISTKCEPHATHNGDMLLMGDAAHSMAPFYAQGMNSAFEDCLVLFDKLKENNFDFPKAFSAYNETRVRDTHAIVDLSMYNHREMTHYVTLRSFHWRKKIDNALYRLFPRWWIPLYTMVTFTRIPYHQCMALRKRQDRILQIVRGIGYSIVGILLLRRFAWTTIKPFIMRFFVDKVLPKVVTDKVT
ncbi:unnamed protein product [Rotaria sp. Silwood2]|nr:unnamed protein product [Rotaria sp. Silwood2]CAF2809275.1 unnamed protein product [Rotaria sp. Silwood2]